MFENEKVKNIALFPQKIRMGRGRTVCFSDDGNKFSICSGIICYLRKIYGEEIKYPGIEFLTHQGNVFSINSILWFDPDYKEDELDGSTAIFEETQWMISRRKNYSFAAKGGHNGEPHNHNDIGSFMIVAPDDSIPLVDVGSEKYRKETFTLSTRYTILNHCSWGHSVPIINSDGYQIYGKQYKAKNACIDENSFSLDIEDAYEEGLVKKINREFNLLDKSIKLCDTFEFSDKTEYVTERFVSLTKPSVKNGKVDLESASIIFDPNKYDVVSSVETYISRTGTVEAYMIDFKGKIKAENYFEFEIEVR